MITSAEPPDQIADEIPGTLEGVAVIADLHGEWQYSINDGGDWVAFGSPSEERARLLAANDTTRVRFVPDAGYWGAVDPGVEFSAWDRTSGVNGGVGDTTANGGTAAFSIVTETAAIGIQTPAITKRRQENAPAAFRKLGEYWRLGRLQWCWAHLTRPRAMEPGFRGACLTAPRAIHCRRGEIDAFVAKADRDSWRLHRVADSGHWPARRRRGAASPGGYARCTFIDEIREAGHAKQDTRQDNGRAARCEGKPG